MKYQVTVYDMSKGVGPEKSSFGFFEMEADSELKALLNVSEEREYKEILKSLSKETRHNAGIRVDNVYTNHLDVSVHASGSVYPQDPENRLRADNIHPKVTTLKAGYRTDRLYPGETFTARVTGENSFEVDMSYRKPIPEIMLQNPEFGHPVFTAWDDTEIHSATFTIVDRNKERNGEMEAWGQPSYYDKEGNPVYQKEIMYENVRGAARETDDDFTKAVEAIPESNTDLSV